LLTICAMRFDVDLDKVAETVSHFAPSLTPVWSNEEIKQLVVISSLVKLRKKCK
jgi:hypothetical protein